MTIMFIASQIQSPHGFFTRRGGISTGIFNGLNISTVAGDNPDHVSQNRQIVCDTLNQPNRTLVTLKQIHGNIVHIIEEPGSWEGDGLVTRNPDILIGVLTADCCPVLFYDPVTNTAGACHAGWKGALAGVIENTIANMESIGCDRTHIHSAFGPCMYPKNFQVQDDFVKQFPPSCEYITNDDEKVIFDLPKYVNYLLMKSNINTVHDCSIDTYDTPDLFYSYRRACHRGESQYGRMVSCIGVHK